MSSFNTTNTFKVLPTEENRYPDARIEDDGWHYRCTARFTSRTFARAMKDSVSKYTAEYVYGSSPPRWYYVVNGGIGSKALVVPDYAGTLITYQAILAHVGAVVDGKNEAGVWYVDLDFVLKDATP